MAANAQRVIVAVDGTKIGKVTLAKMVPLSQIDHLVTDSGAMPGSWNGSRPQGWRFTSSMWAKCDVTGPPGC
jgi:DeoR/GlpR family transcriptional regulator of sugar metabolism